MSAGDNREPEADAVGGDAVPGPSDADPRAHEALRPRHIEETFDRALDEGRRRMSRPLVPLIATGLVGGIDIGTGVLAMLLVKQALGDTLPGKLVAGLAFSVGLIALALARSELFTEDFLIPVTTVVARRATLWNLLRLWGVTLVANLVGGWIITALLIAGLPELGSAAVAAGQHYIEIGLGWHAFALALLGGIVMTLMTWMQHSSTQLGVKIIPAITTGFLLIAGGLNHAIISSLLLFAGLHTGAAPYTYLDWAATFGWGALGNLVGGVLFVTSLRLLQVPHRIRAEREKPPPSVATSRTTVGTPGTAPGRQDTGTDTSSRHNE